VREWRKKYKYSKYYIINYYYKILHNSKTVSSYNNLYTITIVLYKFKEEI